MTDINVSSSLNGLSMMGILDTKVGNSIQNLQNLNSRTSRALSLPEYGPNQHSSALEDSHSLKSIDSGIPTLEIGNPEPVHCSVLNVKRKQSESEIMPERTFQSACMLLSYVPPLSLNAEHEHSVRKSSTFPRTGYDTVKLYSPTSKALNRSDDISVCSVSSLSTELSTTLSVSNEDILDFMVTSSSSAIVTLESDEVHFSDVTLNSTKEASDQRQQACCQEADADNKLKILGPFTSFFARNLFSRKQNTRQEKQNDLGWKLFGKVPLKENSERDAKSVQKEWGTFFGPGATDPQKNQLKSTQVRRKTDPSKKTHSLLMWLPIETPHSPGTPAAWWKEGQGGLRFKASGQIYSSGVPELVDFVPSP